MIEMVVLPCGFVQALIACSPHLRNLYFILLAGLFDHS